MSLWPCGSLFTIPFLKSVFYFLDLSGKETLCKWLKVIKLMAAFSLRILDFKPWAHVNVSSAVLLCR